MATVKKEPAPPKGGNVPSKSSKSKTAHSDTESLAKRSASTVQHNNVKSDRGTKKRCVASKEVTDQNSVLSISSSEDEAILLADRPLDPGDSMYRAPAGASRIDSVQRLRERTPIATRRRASMKSARDERSARKVDPAATEGLGSPAKITGDDGRVQLSQPRPRPRPRPVPRRVKSAAIIHSSDGEDVGTSRATPTQPPAPTTESAPPSVPRRLSDVSFHYPEFPSMTSLLESTKRGPNPAHPWSSGSTAKNEFLDTEAEESEADGHASGDERVQANDNAYDTQDSFIDDSPEGVEPMSDGEMAVDTQRSRRLSTTSSVEMDVDGTFVGIEEEDPVEMAYTERERRRVINEDEISASTLGVAKHRDFLIKALLMLKSNEGPDPEVPEDEDRQMELATRDSLLEMLGATPPKRRRSQEPSTPLQDRSSYSHSAKGKGKQRASRPEPRTEEDAHGSDDALSDYERRERKRLRTAIQLSKAEQQRRVGEPSGTSTTDVMTPSPLDSEHPSLPHTPPRRRTKKNILDMMASAGAEPATPPAEVVTPTTNTSGHVISYRVFSPPKVNEIPIDMSDPLIRQTAPVKLYNLSQSMSVKSWNPNLAGPGYVKPAKWALQCPTLDGQLALDFLTFTSAKQFGNLSRMELSLVHCLQLSANANRYHAVTKEGTPFVFISSGFLEASQLTQPSPVGLKQRYVRVILHDGEHQRTSSGMCAVFGFESMKTQFARHALQFSTRAEFASSTPNKTSWKGSGKEPVAGLFSGPSTAESTARVSIDTFSLPHNAEVPVFDARDVDDFDVNTDLGNLDEKLPRWKEEIPYGSFVVVGYTATAFFSNTREWTLGLNIQWVIIVGIPDSDQE
ncbi:hypothetical protein NMY22_g4490 [Coprinellus aureogranulatus]|nr:hypothetical protein NMY22_g4490 [Coprinellus aureogranulatus]